MKKISAVFAALLLSMVSIASHAFANTTVETIMTGRTLSVGLPAGAWQITSNTNPSVASASITGDQLIIKGQAVGNSTVTISNSSGETMSTTVAVQNTTTGNVLGAITPKNGQLIKVGNAIFQIYKNQTIGFTNFTAFKNLGYSTKNVVTSNENLASANMVVSTAKASHPYGTWIKSKGTIYFVHENGLIPVADYPTFLNNGGNDALVVVANSYDLKLPMLGIMQTSDSRLQ